MKRKYLTSFQILIKTEGVGRKARQKDDPMSRKTSSLSGFS
jgi:hypothetical protein